MNRSTIFGGGGDLTIPSPAMSPQNTNCRGQDYIISYVIGKMVPRGDILGWSALQTGKTI